jgi:HIV Tat-specific factor 1
MAPTSVSINTSGSTVADHTASFSTDPRIAFNKVTGKWEFEDDDGNEMEWDMVKNSWVPVVRIWPSSIPPACLTPILQIDEELVKQQQAVYKVEGVDEDVCRISFPTILPVLILNAKLRAFPAPR